MATILVLRLILIVVAMSASCTARSGDLRVYQGEDDTYNEFPFAVLMQVARKPFDRVCSGSLIAGEWVLTAGHCIIDVPMIIKYGEFNRTAHESKSYTKILKIFLNPDYIKRVITFLPSNDIALILVEKVPNKKHGKLLALGSQSLYGLPVKYAGFGFATKSREGFAKDDKIKLNEQPLKVGEGIVIPCPNYWFHYGPTVCIVPKCTNYEQQARPGDSGGPLIYNGRIIGVAMSIEMHSSQTYYTDIGPFLSWFTNTIESNRN